MPVSAFGRLAAGLTMLLVTSLMTVLALPSAPAGAATRAVLVPLTTPDQTPCQDVFFLGARGSGESGNEKWGLGDTVLPTLNWYRDGVSGRSVAFAGVKYPANPVSFNPFKAGAYFRGVSAGVSAALAKVKERHAWCPRERIVLAGYSQGAMVMHRVFTRLHTTVSPLLASLDGVILIGDGDLVPRDRVTRYGSAGVGVTHYGVGYDVRAISGTRATRVPEKYRGLVHSVCQGHDIVCDWRYKDLAHPLRVHAGYRQTSLLRQAASAVALRTIRRPAPEPLTVSTGSTSRVSPASRAPGLSGLPMSIATTPGRSRRGWATTPRPR